MPEKCGIYLNTDGDEVDMIVEKANGDYAAFEVKLGDDNLDETATKLLEFKQNVATDQHKRLVSLNIIVGVGVSYARPDGVNVIALNNLGK